MYGYENYVKDVHKSVKVDISLQVPIRLGWIRAKCQCHDARVNYVDDSVLVYVVAIEFLKNPPVVSCEIGNPFESKSSEDTNSKGMEPLP